LFVDGSRLARIDPTHPTLRGFELEYHWESVEEEDLTLGIQVLFISAVFGFFVLAGMLFCYTEIDYITTEPNPTSVNVGARNNSGKYRR
jgi:hypothetical protein